MASDFTKAAVVIPSRNRADLAWNAIRSVLNQPDCPFSILVSDNSTTSAEQEDLAAFCHSLNDARVKYIRPPEPFPMPNHWEWAMQQALGFSDVSHVLYLSDRMILKSNTLKGLLRLVVRHPDKVISYGHDRIDDYVKPIRLEQYSRSGNLFELQTSDLLSSSAQLNWFFFTCLPRMVNCIVPRNVLDAIRERYGNIFLSIAPDLCFAYRCLERLDSILYYDKSMIVEYAQDRSNGGGQARGVISAAFADFLANLNGKVFNYAAPMPEFPTVMNTILHEYCCVKNETGSGKFPEVNRDNYFDYIATEMNWMEEGEIKQQVKSLLDKHTDHSKEGMTTSLRHFRWYDPPKVTEFHNAAAALEYATTNRRSRNWRAAYEESNIPVKFISPTQAAIVKSVRLSLTVWDYLLNEVSRILDRYILWRFN